jgi:hypothetical protein
MYNISTPATAVFSQAGVDKAMADPVALMVSAATMGFTTKRPVDLALK